MIIKIKGKRFLVLKLQFGAITYKSEEIELKPGPVNLKIKGEKSTFTFSYSQGNADYFDIETVDSKFLSSETVGGFTGVYVGLYATGNGKPSKETATFDWFEYEGK
jgi:alpha-N-arabinofuranosidase